MRGYHKTTKLSKQIQDQWTQLRSNSPSARAERERAVLAFSNSSLMAKYSASHSVNTLLSLCAVVVQDSTNTSNSENEAAYGSDGDSSQDQLDIVINQDQFQKVIDHNDQGESSECSYATHPVQDSAINYNIKQTQLKEQAEEAGSEESVTVSTAHTRLWRKNSTSMACLQATWKQQVDEELVQKKFAKEKETVQEKQAQKREKERTQEKITEAEEVLLRDELKIAREALTSQKEFTQETPIQPDVVHSTVTTAAQPSSVNSIRLVCNILLPVLYAHLLCISKCPKICYVSIWLGHVHVCVCVFGCVMWS